MVTAAANLLGHWYLNEPVRDDPVVDYSGNGITGTAVATWSPPSLYAPTPTLDVPTEISSLVYSKEWSPPNPYQRIDFTDNAVFDFDTAGDEVSLTAWVKPIATGDKMIFSKWSSTDSAGWSFAIDINKKLVFDVIGSGYVPHKFRSVDALPIDGSTWMHIGVRWISGTGSSAKLYVNGTNVSASWVTRDGDMSPPATPGFILKLGIVLLSSSSYLGWICDTRIYDSALTADDFAAIAAGDLGSEIPPGIVNQKIISSPFSKVIL